MEDKIKEFKELFHHLVKKYHLPDQNISLLLFDLSDRIEQNAKNEELHQLLVMTLCAGDYLLAHFYPPITKEEDAHEYKTALKKIAKIEAAIENEHRLPEVWESVKKRKTLPDVRKISDSETKECQTEAAHLYSLCKKYIYKTDCNCPELYNNLFSFCKVTRIQPNLHKAAPFFFYQIIVRHTSRLASTKEFQFSLKNLWDYKEYRIQKNNGKNFVQYQSYMNLFLALCRYYKSDKSVDLQLCRYAFSHSSNLMEWILCYEPKKARKCETKLYSLMDKWKAASHCESWIPDEFDSYAMFHVKAKKYGYYILGPIYGNELDYSETIADLEIFIMNYIADHAEYIIDCMHHLYQDPEPIKHIVQEIYEKAMLNKRYPSLIPVKYRMAHIYDLLLECLDVAVKGKVYAVICL